MGGDQDLMEPLGAKDRPDGQPEQQGCGHGRLDTLGQAQHVLRRLQFDGSAQRTAQGEPGIGKVARQCRFARIEEIALYGDKLGSLLHRGDDSGTKLQDAADANGRSRMVAQSIRPCRQPARIEITATAPIPDHDTFVPDPSCKSRPGGHPSKGDFDRPCLDLGYGKARQADRSQDIGRLASGKTFEEQRASANPHRQAWVRVRMRRAKAHAPAIVPMSAKTKYDCGAGGI